MNYDVVIIGSGAGGGTMALALSNTGARVLIIERGDFIPQEQENWSAEAVWKDRRYRPTERWLDGKGKEFAPYTHYCVGGNTKFWGSVLYRFRREDFLAVEHADGISPAWPINYDTLEPYYARAEQLYHVHGRSGVDPTEPARGPYPYAEVANQKRVAEVVVALKRQGLHPSPLPLGLREGCRLCNTCNSFACKVLAKSEADVCCVRPALTCSNVELWRNAYARRLVVDNHGDRVIAVDVEYQGETRRVHAALFVAACGAINSAALLLRSHSAAHPNGLANSSGLVGRRYMAHLATMISGYDPRRRNDTVFQKTVAINDFYFGGAGTAYPLGQIQSQGRTDAVALKSEAPAYARWIPLTAWKRWAAGAVDWLAVSEDLPRRENRVTVHASGRVQLHYQPNNIEPHHRLVQEFRRRLRRLGFWSVRHSLGIRNTTHQCGTVVFGRDPRESVLDPFCRAHDVANLFVVDASFFPSSAAVNPGLTIAATALRVADHIKQHDLKRREVA